MISGDVKFRMSKLFFLFFLISTGFVNAQDTPNHNLPDTIQRIIPGRTNRADQLKKSYIILISADGFRYDLADKYRAENLIRLRTLGVEADYMQPVFPSLTFPNHYSIATGEYPTRNGIVDNTFYDPSEKRIYSMNNRKAVEDSS